MLIKRLLLLLPILIAAVLFQSYFWVPTFSDQTKGGDERLRQFITGSIGDAQILNPILHADTASGAIVDQIFEGLIDRDRDLSYRGRLATSWKIYEEAFFVPHPEGPGAKALAARIAQARDAGEARWLKNIEKIEVSPPAEQKTTIRTPPPKGKKKPGRNEVVIAYPERVKMTLKNVDQDLFKHLEKWLGKNGIAKDPDRYVKTELPEKLRPAAARRVILTEHNPVIIFQLRRGVRFHDGHEFDSGDVRFTYNAIINPKNLSPRVPDYEPVKRVETPDKFTVKVTYKRLYSPAFGTWAMGMLPEHLLNAQKLAQEAKSKGKDSKTFSLRDSAFNRNPVGTGAFIFKEWRSDELIRLARNEDYWEGPPEYHEYVYRILPDPLTQEITFYAGTVDRYGAGAHQVERLKKDPRFQVFSGLGFGFTYVGYNHRRWPFQDARVRRALGLAVNTKQIHRYVLNGEAEDITGPFIKQSPHYNKKNQAPGLRPQRCGAPAARGGVQEKRRDPDEGRQAAGLQPDDEPRQRDQARRRHRGAGLLEEDRRKNHFLASRVGRVHPKARQPAQFRRGRPRLEHGFGPRPLPDLAFEPDEQGPAQFRGLQKSQGR